MKASNVEIFPFYDRMIQVGKDRRDNATDAISKYLLIEAGAVTVVDDRPSAQVFDIAEEAAKRSKG